MSRHYIFQCKTIQKSFYLSESMDIGQFCRLLKTVFELNENIAALQDVNGNIYDPKYFCQNLSTIGDRFFIVQTGATRQERSSRSRSRSKQRVAAVKNQKSNNFEIQSPFYLYDFHQFLINLQQRFINVDSLHWTIVLLFDSVWQATYYYQRLIDEITGAYPFIQILFTVYTEQDWTDDTILLTLFANQHLTLEQEVILDQYALTTIFTLLDNALKENHDQTHISEETTTPRNNNIPIIVTRGDTRQVLQVEPSENFHSSQGKRSQGLTRIKRDLERIRDRIDDNEYTFLLDLIVEQDPSIFAAYQLFQKSQSEDQFVSNLKALVPQDVNRVSALNIPLRSITEMQGSNMSFQKPKSASQKESARSVSMVLASVMKTFGSQLSRSELGMFRVLHLQKHDELMELVASLCEQEDSTVIKILQPYLRDQFKRNLEAQFTGSQIDWLMNQSIDKTHPVYAALMNFSQQGNLDELLDLFHENLPQEPAMDYSFPPRQSEDPENQVEHQYSLLLRQKGDKRKSTFKFKIHQGGEGMPGGQSVVDVPQRRKKSEEDYHIQVLKETQFLDKFHNKEIKCFEAEHETMLLDLFEMKIIEDEEHPKIIDFYQKGNQRLRDILDRYKASQDLQQIRQEITDLVSLGNSKRFDETCSPTNGILFESKLQKLKNFSFLINYFYEVDKIFNLKQIKTFYYLYTTEDISLLAAYEVYCSNQDQEDFIQTLILIYKIYSLGNFIELDFEEIEQFDELIDQQLNIMFIYRRFFSMEQRSSLEMNLRAGDNTLLKLFKDFMRTKNQDQFIESTKQFADQRGVALKRIEQILVERRQKRDEQKNEIKDLIEKLHPQFMRTKVKHLDMLLEGVDKDSIFLKSAFEVYKFTLDKQDLVENFVLIYQQIYQANVKTMLKSLSIVLQLQKTDLTALLKRIDTEEPILKGAFELYYINRDEQELKDTITRMIRLTQL